MNKCVKIYFSILFLPILFSACTSERMASRTHHSFKMESKLVSNRPWTIDTDSFEDARVLEIFPIGHKGERLERMRADFYDVFLQNSKNLMTSLFGREQEENSASADHPLVLRVTIEDVHYKAKMMLFTKAAFEISIRFEVIEVKNGQPVTLAEVVCHDREESGAGTGPTYHRKAHERANLAINRTFSKAQKELYDKLSAL